MPKQSRLFGRGGVILLCLFVILFSYFFFFRKENFKLKSAKPSKPIITNQPVGGSPKFANSLLFKGESGECVHRINNAIQAVAMTGVLVLAAPATGGASLIPAAGAAYVTYNGIEETKKAGCR